jgi:ATP-dependent Clp protease ATP-binding subunit ClpA
MLDNVKERIEALEIGMVVEDDAISLLAEQGYDPVYGARPLRRLIQSTVGDSVAEKLLEGEIKAGDSVTVAVKDGKIKVESLDK